LPANAVEHTAIVSPTLTAKVVRLLDITNPLLCVRGKLILGTQIL